MYRLPVYDASGLPLSADTLLGCLRYIVSDSEILGRGPGVGILTSEDRDRWHEAYQLLLEGGNEDALQTVETALFTLSLDPPSEAPAETIDVDSRNSAHAIHAGGLSDSTANRWFDKAIQV